MKRLRPFFCLLVLFAALTRLALGAPNEHKASSFELAKVLQFERDWCNAYLHADTAFLEKYVLDDFTLTNTSGQVSGKAEDIKDLKDGTVKYEVFENRDMKPRIYGDTAVVTGWTKVKGAVSSKPCETDVAFTDTLVRIDGQWYGAAGHVSKPKK